MPSNTISVARPGRWGNPFRVAPAFRSEGIAIPEITRAGAVALYREWLERSLAQYPSVSTELEELRGKNLACFCALDQPCHADVLLELANRVAKGVAGVFVATRGRGTEAVESQ